MIEQQSSTSLPKLKVTSEAFARETYMPSKYTCDGENVSPPLTIKNIPDGTKSVVVIVDDPDAPRGTWVHWVMWNIPPAEKIKGNSTPGVVGTNDFGKQKYGGPCPPSGTHRYFFKVYALDDLLELKPSSTKRDVEQAMIGHIVAQAELIGLYRRED